MVDPVEAPVKSPWASTVNWAVLTNMLASILVAWLAKHEIVITSDQAAVVVMVAMNIVMGLFVWIKHTWFETSVLKPSAVNLPEVKK